MQKYNFGDRVHRIAGDHKKLGATIITPHITLNVASDKKTAIRGGFAKILFDGDKLPYIYPTEDIGKI